MKTDTRGVETFAEEVVTETGIEIAVPRDVMPDVMMTDRLGETGTCLRTDEVEAVEVEGIEAIVMAALETSVDRVGTGSRAQLLLPSQRNLHQILRMSFLS